MVYSYDKSSTEGHKALERVCRSFFEMAGACSRDMFYNLDSVVISDSETDSNLVKVRFYYEYHLSMENPNRDSFTIVLKRVMEGSKLRYLDNQGMELNSSWDESLIGDLYAKLASFTSRFVFEVLERLIACESRPVTSLHLGDHGDLLLGYGEGYYKEGVYYVRAGNAITGISNGGYAWDILAQRKTSFKDLCV